MSVIEGTGGVVYATFRVTLSAASGKIATVNYATSNSTALAGEDYFSRAGKLTFLPGTTAQNLSVQIRTDAKFEPDEQFFFDLSNPSNATIARSRATATILNDDPQPKISINDVSVLEGNSGTTPAVFTVSLSNPSYQDITVQYATADGTATAPSDYMATSGTLIIPAGSTSRTITVLVNSDTTPELNETFTVNLSSPTNATISVATGHGTILNDD
ncbi:MAG TPA: Calx-beta domain-containing protein [Thermoanaerobaculia bacterium]